MVSVSTNVGNPAAEGTEEEATDRPIGPLGRPVIVTRTPVVWTVLPDGR